MAQSDHVMRPHRGRPAQGSDSPAVARVVRGAGGNLSPELDVPKLMLLKETYAAWMERVGLALELVDFLTLKCISALERSMTSLFMNELSFHECGARYPRRSSFTCMQCMYSYMLITFSCSVYNVYYTAVTQHMDNVALSCLLAMANVAVSYCRDGLCRSGLWARCFDGDPVNMMAGSAWVE